MYEWIQMAKKVPKPSENLKSDIINETDEDNLVESDDESDEQSDWLDSDTSDSDMDDNDHMEDNSMQPEFVDADEQFLKDHPLHKTHIIQFDSRKTDFVPNFLGGSLPRRDRGDREYYCATMLTLFKPWRSGYDLKDEDCSWDETFTAHKFTERQLQLMNYFNIRYECNDARDDFSAKLKTGDASNEIFPNWMSSDVLNELDDDNIDQTNEGDDFGDEEGSENDSVNKYTTLGPYGKQAQAQMDATENILRSAGWLDDSPDGLNEINKIPLQPETQQPGSKWKAAVQKKRQQILDDCKKYIPNERKLNSNNCHDSNQNDVRVVDQSYLMRNFKAKSDVDQNLIDKTVKDFNLNTEQERAFRIVANHATIPGCEQLKMYLSGMGGTGKSQVIKAHIGLFKEKNESHRFVALGPTGTTAALLGGFTYHSFLGFGTGRNESASIAQLKIKLEGVDYIFIDEVSMVACHEMYKISARLAKALNVFDLPFGGMNMIFAGDFAQLPPVGGASLYSGTIGTQIDSGIKPHLQEAAIGKALWHQVTTVVILRENMRQKSQSADDALLRTALVNMRYGKCTPDDIRFLKTRVAGQREEQPKVASKNFRNAAIICGVHTHKDRINQLGCERFAAETNQTLTHFYSIDKWGKESDPASKTKWGKSKAASKSKHKSNEINFDDQHEIWKLRSGATEHFPGKLSLCIGMPVMIRNNDATELCITKGQEGFVVGWQASKGPHNKRVLDTLFVKLNNPPQLVQIPGLPDNVVPIVKSTKTITCMFLSDIKESIERQQVWIQPNFAMTCHASQGKSRDFNPVNLNSCSIHKHMGYYTALSQAKQLMELLSLKALIQTLLQEVVLVTSDKNYGNMNYWMISPD